MTSPRLMLCRRPLRAQDITSQIIQWSWTQLGTTRGFGQSFAFVSEALEMGGVQLSVGNARELISRCRMSLQSGIPPEGALVLYAFAPEGPDRMPRDEGFCALSLGCGDVLYAWNVVREDHYLIIPQLYPLKGWARPQYLGWVSMEQVLRTLAATQTPGKEAS